MAFCLYGIDRAEFHTHTKWNFIAWIIGNCAINGFVSGQCEAKQLVGPILATWPILFVKFLSPFSEHNCWWPWFNILTPKIHQYEAGALTHYASHGNSNHGGGEHMGQQGCRNMIPVKTNNFPSVNMGFPDLSKSVFLKPGARDIRTLGPDFSNV